MERVLPTPAAAADAARAGMSPVLGWLVYEKELGDAAATSSVSGLNAAGNSQSRFFGDGHRRRQEGHDQGAEVRGQVSWAQRRVHDALGADQVGVQGDVQEQRGERQLQPAARRHREYFTAKGTFSPATKSFAGELSFVGKCQGTSTIRAKKL